MRSYRKIFKVTFFFKLSYFKLLHSHGFFCAFNKGNDWNYRSTTKKSKANQQPNKTLKLKTENDKDREKKTILLFSKVTFSPKIKISD